VDAKLVSACCRRTFARGNWNMPVPKFNFKHCCLSSPWKEKCYAHCVSQLNVRTYRICDQMYNF
jgi:hypothetical protein